MLRLATALPAPPAARLAGGAALVAGLVLAPRRVQLGLGLVVLGELLRLPSRPGALAAAIAIVLLAAAAWDRSRRAAGL